MYLLGKHKLQSNTTCPWPCLAIWYTIAADVTVLPVPGGPWMRLIGFCSTLLTAKTYNNWQVYHSLLETTRGERHSSICTAKTSIYGTSTQFDNPTTSNTIKINFFAFLYIAKTMLIGDSYKILREKTLFTQHWLSDNI